jgi:DNA-directed RNA polymerase specialized sigma24 family protein
MSDQKKENRYFRFYNKRIMKYLSKHRKKYDYDTINQFRNDIFIKLYTNKSKLPKKENELDKYIYITCKNYILDYKRANKPYIEYTQDNEFLENALTSNNIEDDYIIPEHYNTKFKSFGELKYNILEYKKNGYSINEISKILKLSRTNTYSTFKKLKNNENF